MVRLPVLPQNYFFGEAVAYDASGPSFNLTRVRSFSAHTFCCAHRISWGLAGRALLPGLWAALPPLALRAFRRDTTQAVGRRIGSTAFSVMRSAVGTGPSVRLVSTPDGPAGASNHPNAARRSATGRWHWRYKLPKMGTPMITPQQPDLGHHVVYDLRGLNEVRRHQRDIHRRMFVRFDHQHYSRAVNPAYLEFAERHDVRISQP